MPDLMISTEKDEKIYIEIAVTHESTHEKINSKNRIIEFIIEKEEDLDVFKLDKLSKFDSSIELYNFSPKPIEKKLKDKCQTEISYFVVCPNGKCNINTDKIYKFDKITQNKNLYIKKIEYSSGKIFVNEAREAFRKGVNVKNCFLCRYHAVSEWKQFQIENKPIFCKFYKETKQSNFAADCDIYRPDPSVFENNEK